MALWAKAFKDRCTEGAWLVPTRDFLTEKIGSAALYWVSCLPFQYSQSEELTTSKPSSKLWSAESGSPSKGGPFMMDAHAGESVTSSRSDRTQSLGPSPAPCTMLM